jgi:hypothetical protein
MRYAVIRYLQFTTVNPMVEPVSIANTAGLGIGCEDGAEPKLTNVTYARTGEGNANCRSG